MNTSSPRVANGEHATTAAPHIAALYVETGGCYFGLDGVDPWDEARDARNYDGPWPVVAHPPCRRWGKLWAGQPLFIKRTGIRKVKGDDDGCFAAALAAVRRHGGILEHPWGSHAWPHFGLAVPPRKGGWVMADEHGGWTCCVEQGRYGHYARKPTLLLVYGVDDLPELDWGESRAVYPQWALDRYGLARCKRAGELAFKGGGTDSAPRIGTPKPFRDLLIAIARSAGKQRKATPPIIEDRDGVDWTHLRRDMEHRLVTFTRPDSLNDWRAGKLAGLGHNLHGGGDSA